MNERLLRWAEAYDSGRHLVSSNDGFKMLCDPSDNNISEVMKLHHVWEPNATEFVKSHMTQCEGFVDCGAHWGYYTCLAGKILNGTGRIYSFEVNPRAFRYLVFNILLNELENVTPVMLPLWNKSEKVEYWPAAPNTGNSTVTGELIHPDNILQAITLDEYFGDEEINFIKVDCEGTDAKVIMGAKRLLTENSPCIMAESPPAEFLGNLGYTHHSDGNDGAGQTSRWSRKTD